MSIDVPRRELQVWYPGERDSKFGSLLDQGSFQTPLPRHCAFLARVYRGGPERVAILRDCSQTVIKLMLAGF